MGNTTITVRYGRKQTDKLGDGSFDSIELGGDVTLEVAEDENPFTLYEQGYKKLAEAIEQKLAEYAPREIQAPVRTPSPYGADEQRKPDVVQTNTESDTNSTTVAKTGRGWIEDQIKTNTEVVQERMQTALPGEKIAAKTGNAQDNAIDEYGTPSTSVIEANEAVMFQKCRVFEVEVGIASNKNPFVKVRIGKRGEDGIPGQYTTCRSFEADVIKQVAVKGEDGEWVKKIRDGDFVDVWGYFKPWKNNADKFDLELQKIQLHED